MSFARGSSTLCDYVKPMLHPHGGWPMAAGPVSRLGSFKPGIKQGSVAAWTGGEPSNTGPDES